MDAHLCMAALRAGSAEEVVRALCERLVAAGHVLASFEGAALSREKSSPTGLPFFDVDVAIPHAGPEHVISPALALATLVAPVEFRQMGSPAIQLAVSLVVIPALTAKEQAAAELAHLIERLQHDDVRHALMAATTAEELARIASGWEGGGEGR
jgi:PTS system galactitol-specific IIA component